MRQSQISLNANLAALASETPGASRTVAWVGGRRTIDVPALSRGSGTRAATFPAGTRAVGAVWPIPHVADAFTLFLAAPPDSSESLRLEAFDGSAWVPVRQDLQVTTDPQAHAIRFTFEPVATSQMRILFVGRRRPPVTRIHIRRYAPELVDGRITWPSRMINRDLAEDFMARPEEPDFEALSLHGLSMPTWAMMGLKDFGQEQAVNWDGELYTRPCRIAMSLGRDAVRLPAVRDTIRRRLMDGYLPGVIVEAQIGMIAIRQTSFTVFADDAQRLAALYVRIELRNVGRATFRGPLEIAVKPPTVLRMQDPPPTIPLKLAFKDGMLMEDDTVYVAGLSHCRAAKRPNTLPFDVSIAPGRTVAVDLVAPQSEPTACTAATLRRIAWNAALRRFRAYWQRTLAPMTRVQLPEARLNNMHRAILTQLFINAHGNIMPYGAMPGGYELEFFGIEEGYAMQALAFFGFLSDAQRYMEDTYLTNAFLTKVEEYHSWPDRAQQCRNGLEPMYATELFRIGRDRAWIRKHVDLIKRCAEWTIANRAKTVKPDSGVPPLARGLLPKWTFGGDIADRKCYGFFANFACWRGLQDSAWLMREMGDRKTAARYLREAEDYRRCLLRAVDGVYRADARPPMLPLAVDTDATTGGEYYQLIAGIILDMLPFEFSDRRANYFGDFLERDNRTFCGLARFRVEAATVDAPHTVPGMLDAIYSMGHLLTRLHQGRVREFLLGFYAYQVFNLEHDSFGSRESNPIYASDVHLRTLYRTSEVTDPLPCASAVALHLLRHMLVTEETRGAGAFTGGLQLLFGAPRKWFEHGKRIRVEGAPTHFGKVSFLVESQVKRGLIRADVTMPRARACASLKLRLRHPQGRPMTAVSVQGRPHHAFDAEKELVVVNRPAGRLSLTAQYG